jgi:hypothetical protein
MMMVSWEHFYFLQGTQEQMKDPLWWSEKIKYYICFYAKYQQKFESDPWQTYRY